MTQAPDLEQRLFLLERELEELKRGSQYAIPERRGSLREKLLPNSLFLGERRVSNEKPGHGASLVYQASDVQMWGPRNIPMLDFPGLDVEGSHHRWYDIDDLDPAGFGPLGSSDTLADPDDAPGTYNASIYYLNLGYYDQDTGNLIGRTEGWFTPNPANLGAADTAADGSGPYWYINSTSGVTRLAHPTLDTRYLGYAIVYFGLGDGTGQPLRLESRAGTPTHSATEGTLCADRTNNKLYVNTDGGTTWMDITPLTTKGDIYTYSTVPTRLAVVYESRVLGTNSSETTGLQWLGRAGTGDLADVADAEATGSSSSVPYGDHVHKLGILTTKGDLIGYSTLPIRLGIGTDGYVLTADSTAATGLAWDAAGGGMKRGSYFPLPTAVAAGVTLTKSASANTLGAFTTIATPTADGYIMGVVVEDWSAANNYAYMVIDASPRYIDAETIAASASAATLTLSLSSVGGTTTLANDIIIVSIISKNNTESITVDAGWTKFVEVNWGATDEHRTTIAWKRSAGSEGNSDFSKLTNDGNLLAATASLWRGCVTSGSPLSGTATTSDNASSDTVTYATFTPTYAGDTVVANGFYADDQTTLTVIAGTDPTFASNNDQETTTGTDASIFIQSGPSISGFPTGAKTHITTSTNDAVNLGVLFALTGGGSAVVKFSATATAATAQYEVPLPIPVLFKSGHIIRGAWAGNNAVADTCVVSLICAGGLQDV